MPIHFFAVMDDISALSFEDSLKALEEIVSNLERGETPLEDSIAAYERGIKLKQHCEKKLKEAQSKIEKISINDAGDAVTEPFELES